MKKFKKILLTLVLACAVFMPSIVSAEATSTKVKNQSELENALTKSGTIVIDDDFTISKRITIEGKDIVFDLNNHTITFATGSRLNLKNGEFKFTGNGTLLETVNADSSAPVVLYGSDDSTAKDYTVVTVGENVTLKGGYFGIFISYDVKTTAYGIVLDIYGTVLGNINSNSSKHTDAAGVYINGMIKGTEGNIPVINIHEGATIADENCGGIYAAGYAKWNLEGVKINAGTFGISAKAGIINLTNVTVNTSSAYNDPAVNNNGIFPTGAAVQIESNKNYAKKIKMTIDGGSFTSTNGYGIHNYLSPDSVSTNTLESLTINGAKVSGAKGAISTVEANNVTVTSGTFSSDVSKYVPEGYVQKDVSGQFVVSEKEVTIDAPSIDTSKKVTEVTVGVKTDDTLKNTLKEAIKKQEGIDVAKAADVEVVITNQKSISVSDIVAQQISTLLNRKDLTLGEYFDITLKVKDSSNNLLGTLDELDSKITFQVALPSKLLNTDDNVNRTYYVIRYHDGVAEILNATLSDDNVLTFASDKFSTYAIAYVDKKADANNESSKKANNTSNIKTNNGTVKNPQTYDGIMFYIATGAISVVALAGALVYRKKFN